MTFFPIPLFFFVFSNWLLEPAHAPFDNVEGLAIKPIKFHDRGYLLLVFVVVHFIVKSKNPNTDDIKSITIVDE